jgi:endonuclease YncB( thermonuclease family)
MSNELVETKAYQKLRDDLAGLLLKGQQDALNKLNEIRLNTYWQMGKRLSEERELLESEASGQILAQLADGLKLELSLIYRILQFYRTWPDGVPATKGGTTLSWAHFTELLAIKDPKERDYYLEEASRMGWGRNILRKAIKKDLFTTSKQPAGKEATTTLTRDPNPLFTYKAIVENVVDGDTLAVRIDLGFNVWVSQRIRFRGINTAELVKGGVPAGEAPGRGEQAKAYVEEKLKDIEFIVIKTYKTDMYGRYVADVFYHPTIKNKEDICTAGFFLNQEILAAGLADVML